MNSSINQLKETLIYLTDGNQDAYTGDFSNSAARQARYVAEFLEGVNDTLCQGWRSAEELSAKIFYAVKDIVADLYRDVELFTDEVYQAELAAKNAVEEANEAAMDILKELGLLL